MTWGISAATRRAWQVLVTAIACFSLVQPATALAAGGGRPRYAAILMDARTGEVLYANAADEQRHPASITKVMTLFLAFDAMVAGRLRLSDPIVMSYHAASQRPSKLGLAPGRSISLENAIHIITVKSANDVAVALAERLGGSETAFAQQMTRKARALGMTNTTFTNATGLPDRNNVTTARDIAILSAALLRAHPSYYAYFGQQAFKYDNRNYTNHNRLLGKLTGLDGIKTGFTNDAGFTLAASALRNGQRLITVVLGEPSIAARNRDVTALLDAGFTVLERRSQGENTSVAFNLPTLNHPALRLADTGEMGSRTETSAIRRPVAAPARAPTRSAEAAPTRHKSSAKSANRSSAAKAAAKKGKASAHSKTQAKSRTAAKGATRAKDAGAKTSRTAKTATAKTATAKAGTTKSGTATATAKTTTSSKREREAANDRRKTGKTADTKSGGKRDS
jgi:D-alanyl-D-alanine carboxypeptidase